MRRRNEKEKRSSPDSGKYLIHVCRGEACAVMGADKIAAAIRRELNMEEGGGNASPGALFSLEEVSCIGACERAPVVLIEGHEFARSDPEKAARAVKRFRAREEGKRRIEN